MSTLVTKWIGAPLLACLFIANAHCVARADTPGAATSFTSLRYVTIVVRDYDEALDWYTKTLGFAKVEDRAFGPGRRWVVVAPGANSPVGIVFDIAKSADGKRDLSDLVGKERNWVFRVEDVRALYDTLSKRGVRFTDPPQRQPWGTTQATFTDLYGNVFVVESGPG